MVNVKLTGQLIMHAPEGSEKGSFTVEHKTGMTLSALLAQIGVDNQGLKYKALVNNENKPADHVLEDNDLIIIMPLLSGG